MRQLPNAIPCRLASALSFICSCCSGQLMSTFMAAFKALIACSMMLRNGLYDGSLFKLKTRTRNGRIVVGWCAVINENHMFIWVDI